MAAAAAATSSSTSSSSHQQPPAAAAVKIGLEIGLFRPPGSLLLRLILRHFRHEIRWCFAASDVFRKRCLAVSFLLERLVDCSSSSTSSSSQNWISGRISEGAFRPPGSFLLRLILRHFRHEIRSCFAASDVFRKSCSCSGVEWQL